MAFGLKNFVLPAWFALLLTAATVLCGIYFYYTQLLMLSPYLWLTVPDSPFYAVLIGIIVMFDWPRNQTLRFIIACGCALCGSWILLGFANNPSHYFETPLMTVLTIAIVIGQIGIILQALLCLPKKPTKTMLILALGWLLTNIYIDYQLAPLSIRPQILTANLGLVETLIWTIGLCWPLLLIMLAKPVNHNHLMVWIRKHLRAHF